MMDWLNKLIVINNLGSSKYKWNFAEFLVDLKKKYPQIIRICWDLLTLIKSYSQAVILTVLKTYLFYIYISISPIKCTPYLPSNLMISYSLTCIKHLSNWDLKEHSIPNFWYKNYGLVEDQFFIRASVHIRIRLSTVNWVGFLLKIT